jgi:hypothetical protein
MKLHLSALDFAGFFAGLRSHKCACRTAAGKGAINHQCYGRLVAGIKDVHFYTS